MHRPWHRSGALLLLLGVGGCVTVSPQDDDRGAASAAPTAPASAAPDHGGRSTQPTSPSPEPDESLTPASTAPPEDDTAPTAAEAAPDPTPDRAPGAEPPPGSPPEGSAPTLRSAAPPGKTSAAPSRPDGDGGGGPAQLCDWARQQGHEGARQLCDTLLP